VFTFAIAAYNLIRLPKLLVHTRAWRINLEQLRHIRPRRARAKSGKPSKIATSSAAC
jgi:hypothetical protein